MTAGTIEHEFGFDPTHGMDLGALLAVAPPRPPADFVPFWQARYAAAMRIHPVPRLDGMAQRVGAHAAFDLHYRSGGGVEVGSWPLLPLAAGCRLQRVETPGTPVVGWVHVRVAPGSGDRTFRLHLAASP